MLLNRNLLLSHKMESRGGPAIWKGHIWGPPLRVFTFRDKWGHWVLASCEWAPSAHMGFLNAHQNNLSKPRDAFLRCLMWGQIGNHFNKIPLRWNCISQKTAAGCWGETQWKRTVERLPEVFKGNLKRLFIVLAFFYGGQARNRYVQKQISDWSHRSKDADECHRRQRESIQRDFKHGAWRRKASAACLFLHVVFLRLKRQ